MNTELIIDPTGQANRIETNNSAVGEIHKKDCREKIEPRKCNVWVPSGLVQISRLEATSSHTIDPYSPEGLNHKVRH